MQFQRSDDKIRNVKVEHVSFLVSIAVNNFGWFFLTHWGRVTHICVSKLSTIGSDNGLSPTWRQAIIWTNARILLIGPLGTNFSEILIKIPTFSFKKMRLKLSSWKWRPFCLGLNVLNWRYFKMTDELSVISQNLTTQQMLKPNTVYTFLQHVSFNDSSDKSTMS